jgi:cell division protein FtsI/penicillin-binding protein 2
VEFATASFGQGIAMTPIETVRALAALGNGGKLVTPHLVKAVKYDNGVTRSLSWGEGEQMLKPETSTTISRMLTTVVDTKLADGKLKMEHYSIAAKTGTAQIANPNGGGYYTDKYLHSFFGYFPSYDPKFIVFLFAVEPKGAPFASQTWAPPFGEITKFLINYYNIPPDR